MTIGNVEKALAMLEAYTEIATSDIFPLKPRAKGDNFFTLINEHQDKQLSEYPFAMPELPRHEQSIKQDMVDAVIKDPAFSALSENRRFQRLVRRLEAKMGRKKNATVFY